MTQTELRQRMIRGFFPFFLLYAAGSVISYLIMTRLPAAGYYISCPLPRHSLYDILSTAAFYLRGTVIQLTLVFLSVFTRFSQWVCGGIAFYRGLCTGGCLYLLGNGMVSGQRGSSLTLYFTATVLLFLFTGWGQGVISEPRARERYFKGFLVVSGGIFLLSLCAILSS